MDCQYLDEIAELCLLGGFVGGTCAGLREHLERGCPACLEHLREAALTVYLLSQTTRPARPSPKVKSQLLSRLRKK